MDNNKEEITLEIINKRVDDMLIATKIEFDKDLKIYTAFNEIVPQIYGEGTTKDEALRKMVIEAKLFAADYAENVGLFSAILDSKQQFFIEKILLNL